MISLSNIADSLSGLVNKITGTGVAGRDKLMASTWNWEAPQNEQLVALYRSTWIARKIINIPIDDMLRQGWRWQAEQEQISKLEAEERRHGLQQKLYEVLRRDALFGGAALLMGIKGQNPDEELLLSSVGQGALEYLLVLGRAEIQVKSVQLDPVLGYGEPVMFQMVTNRGTVDVHPSRVIVFNGNPAPSLTVDVESIWGDSRLAAVMRDIAAAGSGVAGLGRMMDELAVAYVKINGFSERIALEEGEETIRKTLNLMQLTRSAINAVAMDAEDDVNIITPALTGLPDSLRALMQNIAGAADIPLTRFLGASPDGLNATGASDLRNYYDRLKGQRAHYVEPGVRRLDEVLIASALGKPDDAPYRIWNELWQLNESEQVDLDKKKLEMMTGAANSALVPDLVITEVVKNMMIESPTFQGAEAAFEEAENQPEPDPEEVLAATELKAKRPDKRRALKLVGGMDLGDIAPRTLYIHRPIINASAILAHYKAQVPGEYLEAGDLHITIAYSRNPVDWSQVPPPWESKIELAAGGMRLQEQLGKEAPFAQVLLLRSNELEWRHESIREAGASWDFPEYQPHITLSYKVDLMQADPWKGPIILGPEEWGEVDEGWKARVVGDEQRHPFIPDGWSFEDVKAYMSQPRHPAGSSRGGQFAPKGGGSWGTPLGTDAFWSMAQEHTNTQRQRIWGGQDPDFKKPSSLDEAYIHGGLAAKINGHLRSTRPADASIVEQGSKFLDTFEPLKNDQTVFRGANIDTSKLKDGSVYTDPAFFSASAAAHTAASMATKLSGDPNAVPTVFAVKAKAGTRARGFSSGELELVLPPETSFKILGRETIKYDRTDVVVIYAEVAQ